MAEKIFYGNVGYLEDTDFSGDILNCSVGNNKLHMIFIFSSWCPHCISAFPEYDKFATYIGKDNKNVRMLCIQADGSRESEKNLGKQLGKIIKGFRGFPTIVIYQGGKLKDTLKGERTFDGLKKFLENNQ
jgi:thiol-disulfide isomerase/thioredoxin